MNFVTALLQNARHLRKLSEQPKENSNTKSSSASTTKRGIYVLVVALLAAVSLFLIGSWWRHKAFENPPAAGSKDTFERLAGRWQRPDGGYILAIKSVANSGAIDAAYFNPRGPIHVARAEASLDGTTVKVFVELRDVNYPGSTYALTYDAASDQLKGIYYQAVEKQRFPVAFLRIQ